MLQVGGLRLNQSCTVISVKRSIGIHPTKTNTRYTLQQHICAAFQTKLKAAPCTAILSYFKFCQPRTVARWQKFNTTNLPLAQLRNGKQLRASSIVKRTWLHLIKLLAGSFQRAGRFLSCPRYTAFFHWVVLKDQRGRKIPLGPPPHNIIELTIVILTQMLYLDNVEINEVPSAVITKTLKSTAVLVLQSSRFHFKNKAGNWAHSRQVTHVGLRNRLSNIKIWCIQLICLQFPLSKDHNRAQVTSVLYKAPSFIHTWKSTRKAPPQSPPKRTNAYQNCIQSHQAMHLLCNKKILYR